MQNSLKIVITKQ